MVPAALPALLPLATLLPPDGLAWVESLPCALCVLQVGQGVGFNQAARDSLDVSAGTLPWAAEDEPRLVQALGQPAGEHALQLRAADGPWRWHRLRWQPSPALPAALRLAVLLPQPEASAKAAEAALAEANALALAKDEFLSVVSHNLRSPLNAIRGWAYVLRKQLPDQPALLKPLEAIDRNVATQARMVDELMDTQRLLRGKVALQRQPVALGRLLDQAAEAARALLQERSPDLQVQPVDPGLVVSVDAERLSQALVHLVSSAAQAAGPAPLHLAARCEAGGVALTVDPVAAPPSAPEANGQDAPAPKDTLGMALARQVVQLHGGRLLVRSAGAPGAMGFTLVLPDAPPDPLPAHRP